MRNPHLFSADPKDKPLFLIMVIYQPEISADPLFSVFGHGMPCPYLVPVSSMPPPGTPLSPAPGGVWVRVHCLLLVSAKPDNFIEL